MKGNWNWLSRLNWIKVDLIRSNWTGVDLIGLNKFFLIFRKNKLPSKNFREKIVHYITIQNSYLFAWICYYFSKIAKLTFINQILLFYTLNFYLNQIIIFYYKLLLFIYKFFLIIRSTMCTIFYIYIYIYIFVCTHLQKE